MESALNQIRMRANQSEEARQDAIIALRDLASCLENTHETIHRIGHMNSQAATVQVGIDLGLFKLLAQSDDALPIEQISKKTSADQQLMTRILRYLAAMGAIRELAKGRYTSNRVTQNLSQDVAEAGLSHYFGISAPQSQVLPAFLKDNGYRNPTDESHTPFGRTFGTNEVPYVWFSRHPEHLEHFNRYMALRRTSDLTWLSVYPVADEAAGWPAEKPVYVNIGGGIGHQCAQFRERYSFDSTPGRVILQDMPHSIDRALPTPGVENVAHNFFEPQPIKDAKFYHMRGVLHNHPPGKLRQILENTKAAMGPQSVLLVDEQVLPEERVNFIAACIDITMLSAFASMERTEQQWCEVFKDVGLELVRTFVYNSVNYESVMDVRLPQAAE
ncbi:O-methyl transferase B [Diaporthe sp. PMI_573]|nr:O-methyl transferase B [Diaporthaceae sp. PMI_573]